MKQTENMTTGPTPERTDAEIGMYALVIHEKGQVLYQYDDPVMKDPKWIEQTKVDHSEAPTLDLGHTQVEQRASDDGLQAVVLYTTDLGVIDPDTSNSQPEPDSNHTGDYVVHLKNDGESLRKFSSNKQADAMAKVVSCLIKDHDLINKIKIPYIPGREKAIINNQPTSPHRKEEMRSYRSVSENYYLDTDMNAGNKKDYLHDLVGKCQLELNFKGDW